MKRRVRGVTTALFAVCLSCACVADGGPLVAPPHAAAIPFKQGGPGFGMLAARSALALVLVGLAAYGLANALKRSSRLSLGGARRDTATALRLRRLDSTRLSARSTLHLVEFHGDALLLVETQQGVRLLAKHTAQNADRTGAATVEDVRV